MQTAMPDTPLPTIHSLLIVDDCSFQRDHAARLARELGISDIYEAADGSEALRLLALLKLPPGLMLIDLEMPRMDGIQLIEAMQDLGLTIPYIVASSRETALLEAVEAMARTLGSPVLAAVCKPLTEQSLRAGIQRWNQIFKGPAATGLNTTPVNTQRLSQAISDGEIEVHYQPQLDVRSGCLRGVEALARWTPPEIGVVPPDRFIPQAERAGLIHSLTLAVVDQALCQTADWHQRGLSLSVAVNLSPLLLDRPALVQEIVDLVHKHGLQPRQVVLELTESSLVAGLGKALAMLARFRLKGFGLSIDDYGTGFSSMQQLARVPFTELKIDRSFVNGAAQRKHQRVILESALDMARRLDLVTLGEGIETMEDWRLLQSCGCNVGQGWLIAKAMPACALTGWMKEHRSRRRRLVHAEFADRDTAPD